MRLQLESHDAFGRHGNATTLHTKAFYANPSVSVVEPSFPPRSHTTLCLARPGCRAQNKVHKSIIASSTSSSPLPLHFAKSSSAHLGYGDDLS